MEFNVNNPVKVQLNEAGRKIHKDRHNNTFHYGSMGKLRDYSPPKVDADGYSEFQMWELMQIFGPHISLGGKLPFGVVIRLDK